LILDTSVLVAAERQALDIERLFRDHPQEPILLAAITASELLHGVVRAAAGARRRQRSAFVEALLDQIDIVDFDLAVARRHAEMWASLERSGQMIGAHDLLIAATALQGGHAVATLNREEFSRVRGLRLVDTARYLVG
jgi:predicted nucleic acid-binding protein